MGAPTFYYYPPGGALQTITLPAGAWVASLRDSLSTQGSQETTFGGRVVTSVRRRKWTVDIEIRQVSQSAETATCEALRAMMDAAQTGIMIGFAEDGDEAWLSYLLSPPTYGDTTLYTGGCVGYVPTSTLSQNSRVRVEVYDRTLYRDDHTVGAAVISGATSLTTNRGMRQQFSVPGWVRHDGYHPAMRLLIGEEPEDNDRRLLYSWRFRFLVDLAALSDETVWEQLYTGSSATAATGLGVDDIVDSIYRTADDAILTTSGRQRP